MSALSVPLDLELLTEYAALRSLLATRAPSVASTPTQPRMIEAVAELVISKLFRKLGYLARSTNRPGWLTPVGAQQYREALEPLFAEDCDPVQLLAEAGWLRADGDSGWKCELFGRLNEHLAGDYRPKHMKGNDGRQATIAVNKAAVVAPKQLEILPEFFKTGPDGQKGERFEKHELQRLMVVIGSIDNILQFTRHRTGYTEALINAAARACTVCNFTAGMPKEFREFLSWLHGHRSSSMVPQTTEEVLAEFERLYGKAINGDHGHTH
jgi:hypothetical protein